MSPEARDDLGLPGDPAPRETGPAQAAAPAGGGAGGWKRVHPLTPLIRSSQFFFLLLLLAGQQAVSDGLGEGGEGTFLLDIIGHEAGLIGLILPVVVLVVIGLSVLVWRFMRYRVGTESLEIHTGVLFRQHRSARLDRIQAVDVVQPLVARAVGLARLRVEVAGGSDSKIDLSYLTETQAHQLRAELLARAAGVRFEGHEAPEAPELHHLEVPAPRLISSLFLSVPTVLLVLGLVLMAAMAITIRTIAPLMGVIPALIMLGSLLWDRFSHGFAFRVSTSPDGLRLRHGLLEQQAQTVPPGRIQALRVSQPFLWRRRDWWRIQMIIAGYGLDSSGPSQALNVLLPVGTRAETLGVLAMALPDLGDTGPDTPREVVEAGMTETTTDRGFVTVPQKARFLDPVGWQRGGFRFTGNILLVRHGRFHRTLDLVPHARTQSCGVKQGPVQRRLGLSTFTVHTTPGSFTVEAEHLYPHVCAQLLDEQVRRARLARSVAGPERWMEEQP
ncbi:MAG: putative rane protein [Actinomycetota bacterium]|nr:putative rane protein [Actinomycetota bacterium]